MPGFIDDFEDAAEEQPSLSEEIEELIQSEELNIEEKKEQLKELLKYQEEIWPDGVDRGTSKLSNEERVNLCSFSFIQSILELERENIALVEILVNSKIISSLDLLKLYSTALDTREQMYYDLTYRAASRLEHNIDVDQLSQCFKTSFDENQEANSFQIAVLAILATNPFTQKYLSVFFLSTIQDNPDLADIITNHIKINRDEETSIGQTALQLAAESGNVDLFKFLLHRPDYFQDINKNFEKFYKYLSHRDQTRAARPVLFSIVQSPKYKEIFEEFHNYAVKIIKNRGSSGNELYEKLLKARDEKGNTALTYLINRNLPDVLERLKYFAQYQPLLTATYSTNEDVHSDDNKTNNVLDYVCKFYPDTNQSQQLAEFLLSMNLTSPEVAKKFPDLLYKRKSSSHRR